MTDALHTGDLAALRRSLEPGTADIRVGDEKCSRTLLHIVADWPGHYPNGATSVRILVDAGAEVSARFHGPHEETALHWAASSDDVDVLDALIDCGADIEATGGVIGGGTPLADARAFRQWNAAFRLIERGASVTLFDAATLGLLDQVEQFYESSPPSMDDTSRAFWSACHGGRLSVAQYLLEHGAGIDYVPPWEPKTPLDAALDAGSSDLILWLRGEGARSRST